MSPDDILLLQKLYASCKAELDATVKINRELTAEIERITKPIAIIPPSQTKEKTFKIENKVFGFTMPAIFHNGERITPLEVMADEKLQRELVNKKSGFIKEQK